MNAEAAYLSGTNLTVRVNLNSKDSPTIAYLVFVFEPGSMEAIAYTNVSYKGRLGTELLSAFAAVSNADLHQAREAARASARKLSPKAAPEIDTSAAVAAFLDLAIADLHAHGQVATSGEVARRIGVKAADLSQAKTGNKPASIERLIRWVGLWNGRPFLGGIADYRSDAEIVVEASSATGIVVYSRARP